MKYKIDAKTVREIAEQYGWKLMDAQANIGMVSFTKDTSRINIYLTKMTVATCIDHPKQGKTQLFRRNVDEKTLNKIFKNPRVHTDKGYHRRK